ncbi:MAG: carboxymuconolactone decarboxylase family protein [Acidimicrobiia bacterium]
MAITTDSPKPITKEVLDEGDASAFIPYPPIGEHLEHVPIHVRPELHYYISRMGFLPNTLKLYLHIPWVAEQLFRLNNAVMRDERGQLSEHFKYRLSLAASHDNECRYCTAHHVLTMKRRWDYSDEMVEEVLALDEPADERERVAMEFVHQASLDPGGVTDDLRRRLTEHFTPQEVMEIVLVVGFWKMYNTMHIVMGAPLEDPVLPFREWVDVHPEAETA